MDNRLEKRYDLKTAVSMVIGIVIGSGVFFKAVKVLSLTGGSMGHSLLVIGAVGLICVVCSCVFAEMGTKYVKCNGVVDYAEASLGQGFAYCMGWFMSAIYYPVIGSTLAYISARYTCMLLGLESFGQANMSIAVLYLVLAVVINSLSPKIAGKVQVSMTVAKLVPLVVMGVVGTIVGLVNGNGIRIFTDTSAVGISQGGGFFAAVCAFAFSYEGWIIATTINSELKNPKRDLPLALVGGALFCTIIYMLYTYSMSATMNAAQIVEAGDWLPKIAFSRLFHSNAVGTIVFVFIIVSCLGTTNGVILGCMRGFYSIAVRGQGPKPTFIAEVDKSTGMPLKSCLLGLGVCSFWLFQCGALFFNGPLVMNTTGNPLWLMAWEADEIVIVTQYALYIPIFVHLIVRERQFSPFKRFVLPTLGIAACLFMCFCCWKSYGTYLTVSYLVVFAIIMGIGAFFYRKNPGRELLK